MKIQLPLQAKHGNVFFKSTTKSNQSMHFGRTTLGFKTMFIMLCHCRLKNDQTNQLSWPIGRARVKIACDSVVFKEDGSTEFIYGPMNPIRELGGKRVWF